MVWERPAPWAGLPLLSMLVLRFFNVGRWLTRGDLALEARVDFLAVVEHRPDPCQG